jgi:hypothetical protein
MANNNKNKVVAIEDDIRDLINFIEVKNEEELDAAEGKKIEDDTAAELKDKLRALAKKIGAAL